MIFGFNTDIRHEDTVYHVQSEAREGEQLLQTQVFVRGRCIGKRAISYASAAAGATLSEENGLTASQASPGGGRAPDPTGEPASANAGNADSAMAEPGSDQDKEKLLRNLHRDVLDAIRDGRLDSILDKRETPDTLASVKQIEVQWTNADSVHTGGALIMNLRVTEGGLPIPGARLTLRLARPGATPYYAQILSDADGNAEMSVQVDESALADSSVLVQANFEGRTTTRKFQLRQAN
ncbi:MAG: hypothetical protein WBQ72_22060 [Terriglobales bacterium]|jgi:hypothetical protein